MAEDRAIKSPTAKTSKPTKEECIRGAAKIIAAGLIRVERERLMAEQGSVSEAVPQTGYPTHKPHNSPQFTRNEQTQPHPKPA